MNEKRIISIITLLVGCIKVLFTHICAVSTDSDRETLAMRIQEITELTNHVVKEIEAAAVHPPDTQSDEETN